MSAVTAQKPNIVARPIGAFFRVAQYTLAPSMPMKTKTVTSIVARTCWTMLLLSGSVNVQREHVELEREHQNDDEDDDGHDFRHGHDGVNERRLLDATQDQKMKEPNADRRDDDRD
jgi:hypothetical protein